jgi:hypothetical protein
VDNFGKEISKNIFEIFFSFRHHLACWLEQEIGVIRQLCNLSTSTTTDQDDPIAR